MVSKKLKNEAKIEKNRPIISQFVDQQRKKNGSKSKKYYFFGIFLVQKHRKGVLKTIEYN